MATVQPPLNSDESVLNEDTLTQYLVDEIDRALQAHARAERGTVQRTMALGEALALFNVADQFGLMDALRRALTEVTGQDAYLRFSANMKDALLDRGRGPDSTAPGRPRGSNAASRPSRGGADRPGRPRQPPGKPRH